MELILFSLVLKYYFIFIIKQNNMFLKVNKNIRRVAIYCRVSTDEQAENWTSLDFQKDNLLRYIEFNNEEYTIDMDNHIFIDPWCSWSKDERPELNRMMKCVEQQKIDVVLVYKLDRFFRNTLLLLQYLKTLKRYNVSFESMKEKFDSESPFWKLNITFLWIIAEFERDTISERTMSGKISKSISWFSVAWWKVKYWYRKILVQWWKDLEIIEDEANVIKRIFKLYTEEWKSINKIWNILSVEKVLTRNDKLVIEGKAKKRKVEWFWNESTIRWILKDEIYIWKNSYWKTHWIIDKETWKTIRVNREKWDPWIIYFDSPRIIDDKSFYKAKELFWKNKRILNNKIPHIYTSYVYCWECWRSYSWYKSRKDTISYRCWGTIIWKIPQNERCDNSEISELILTDLLWNKIKLLLLNSDNFLEDYYNKENKKDNPLEKYNSELNSIFDEITIINRMLNNAYKELYKEEIEFKKKIKETLVHDLEKQHENLNERSEELVIKIDKLSKTEKNKSNIKIVISKFNYNLKNKITYKEKTEIIKEFVDKIIINWNWKINISLKFFTWNNDENWYNDDDWW